MIMYKFSPTSMFDIIVRCGIGSGDAAEYAAVFFAAGSGSVRKKNRKMRMGQLRLYGSRLNNGVSQN